MAVPDFLWLPDKALYQITAPHFCAGVSVVNGLCTEPAPILRWTENKPWAEVQRYALNKGWKVAWLQ